MESKICLVTGASRGAGRGIALALADHGATVYVTGRTVRPDTAADNLPGTVSETADLVRQRGGTGIAVACDHGKDSDVRALADRIRRDHGRLDLLVNNAWGGYEAYNPKTFDSPFWEADPEVWDRMINNGVRLTMVTSRCIAPLMIAQRGGLIVNITVWDRDRYLGSLVYDTAKAAINRMTHGMSLELRRYGIAVVGLAPGWMRTERVMMAHEQKPFDLSSTESPEYVGRVVAALLTDPDIASKSGEKFRAGDLAREYGVRDLDGTQPRGFDIPIYSSDGA